MSEVNATIECRLLPDFPGYKVGSDGSVWSCRKTGPATGSFGAWKRMTPVPDKDGYMRVLLSPCRKMRRVHQLVLEAFVGPCPDGMEACHFPDRNPANNTLQNLRWDTPKANGRDKVLHGTNLPGESNGFAKLTEADVKAIRLEYVRGDSKKGARPLGRRFGISDTAVRYILSRRSWKHLL